MGKNLSLKFINFYIKEKKMLVMEFVEMYRYR